MVGFGRAILKYKVWWLLLVIGVTVFLGLQLGRLSMEEDESTWYPEGDPTLEAYRAFESRFESDEFVVVAYDWDVPFSPEAVEELRALSERLDEAVPYVTETVSLATVQDIVGTENALEVRSLIDPNQPLDVEALRERIRANPFLSGNLISQDERTVSIVLEIDRPDDRVYDEMSTEIILALESVLDEEEARTGTRFFRGGNTLTEREVERMLDGDIGLFFPLGLAFTGALLLLFFRNVPSVLLPLVTVVLSLGWTLGLKALVGSPITPVSTTLFALVTVIGVATSVHLISQYWIERARNLSREQTLLATYRRSGKPCLFTALTTAVGFGSLAVSRIPTIRDLGFFAAFGIMTAFFLAMILVPMGLDVTSHRTRRIPTNERLGLALRAIGGFNARRPRLILSVTAVLVVGMGLGILLIETKGSMVDYFRRGSSIRESIDFFDSRLSGISSTEVVLVGEEDAFRQPEVLRGLDSLSRLAEAHPAVASASSFADTVKLMNRAFHSDDVAFYSIPDTPNQVAGLVLLYEMSGGESLRDYVSRNYETARVSIRTRQTTNEERRALLDDVAAYAEATFPQMRVDVTGMDLLVNEVNDRIVLTQIESFGLALVVIAAMMILVFGWRAGLLSMIPNVLPIVFVLGLMGYAGFGLNIATAIIASIAIGIVVDDTIHFFSHFRDELAVCADPRKAMIQALERVGKALCFSTAILAAGFAVFLFARLGILASYGILSGAAVLVALAGDLFVGPALLARIPAFPRVARAARVDEDPQP